MKHARKLVCGILVLFVSLLASELISGQTEIPFKTGLKLATPDQLRGVPLAFTPYSGAELPSKVDLSANMPPPGNQGNLNSCVGWAMAYALKSYEEKVENGTSYFVGNQIDAARVFSPSFIYNQCNNGRDGGVFYPDAFNLLSEKGAATWADMPYNDRDFTTQPSAEIKSRAKRYRIDFWRQVNAKDVKEIKAHLNAGFPVLFGAAVDEAFIKLPSGRVWNSIGRPLGGHAMILVGYDDEKNAFRLMNSWGTNWCEGGFGWVDYDFFRNNINEAYVVKDARDGPPPPEPEPQPEKPAPVKPEPSPAKPTPVKPTPVKPEPTKPEPAKPTPQPPPEPQPEPQPGPPRREPSLAIANVMHNQMMPGRPDLGYFMTLQGMVDIPGGLGSFDQVVVYFYYANVDGTPGAPLRAFNIQFSDVNGFAACGTQTYQLPPTDVQTTWMCWIPYTALATPVGQWVATWQGNVYQPRDTPLLAQAVLFIDNFGVARSSFIPFFVRK